MTQLDYAQAAAIVAAGIQAAAEMGSPSSVAVVDSGRNLLAFGRSDGAILASLEVSQAKAYTAGSLKMPTADLSALVQPGGPFYGLSGADGRPFIPFGGGVPLLDGDTLVGAVGAAGGSPDQDDAVAKAAAATWVG
ncbi:heme-binding protein [Kribbella turkmenica]|uniref:Heme-binding protein n=1 Tax=Kribbella turkmenica TaxID=2530375 RepID=A0A4R4XGX0_9ACTN|nr:heme-binding protein [Kribbella turkmenica]TDD30004.1 heme-binding protein [Kribbella turkmenica]